MKNNTISDLDSFNATYTDGELSDSRCFEIVPDSGLNGQLHPAIDKLQHQAPTDVQILRHFWDDEGVNAFITMIYADQPHVTFLIGVWWADMSWLNLLTKCIDDPYHSNRMYRKYTGN